MKLFKVVALGRFLDENSVEVALQSFAEFYFSVTYKYQKNTKLILIDKAYNQNLNEELAENNKIRDQTIFLSLNEQDEVEKTYREGSLLLLPRIINSSSIIKEAYRYGLPVIGYANSSHDNLLSTSSGMKIEYTNDLQSVQDFAKNLRMLKYDPEAVKMLQKGAASKFEKELSWGRQQSTG